MLDLCCGETTRGYKMGTTHDCIYWYDPDTGRHGTLDQFRGSWTRIPCEPSQVDAMIKHYNQRGFVARRSKMSVGPPSTPPDKPRFTQT
mgnify:CR=1 FL=1